MRWRGAQTTILGALTLLLLGAGIWHAAGVDKRAEDPVRAGSTPAAAPRRTPGRRRKPLGTAPRSTPAAARGGLYAAVAASPSGPPLPAGFLGFSFEYSAFGAYTGSDPAALNPVFVQLLRNLGQPLVLRIGGNSTDATWWPVRGSTPPAGVSYALTTTWLASASALAAAVDAKLILGVNLAADRPSLAAAEAQALVRGVGAGNIAAFEIGNEPDVYGLFPWYSGRHGLVFARAPGYGLTAYLRDAARWAGAIPATALAGPATAELSWLSGIPSLAGAEPRLQVITVHRYPIQGCLANRASPAYPSLGNLLADRSSAGLAAGLAPYVAAAHERGLAFRVDELNSAALAGCLSRAGVSNTFASSVWMLDTLFQMARVGVDGVNVHTLPGAGYELFTFTRATGGWRAFVHPDYYGMLMFARAFPTGARLVPVHAPSGPVKVWATHGADGRTRVTLINQDAAPHRVELQLPLGAAPARVDWLRAPGAAATGGVTLGGQSFGSETSTGVLAGAPAVQTVTPLAGSYSIDLPPYTAALLTR